MTAATFAGVARRSKPRHTPGAVLDQLIRLRSATWLHHAGLQNYAQPVGAWPPVKSWEDVALALPQLVPAARAVRAARDSAWQHVAGRRDQSSSPTRNEAWGAIADAVWSRAVMAADHGVLAATGAVGLESGRALLRIRSRGASIGRPWDAVWDLYTDSASTIAWHAVAAASEPHSPLWSAPPEEAWAAADRAALAALVAVHTRLDALDSAGRARWQP